MDLNFRKLRADEIEARVGIKSKDGSKVCMLLYKDARCDMSILDEHVGAMNWQREHIIRENVISGQRTMVNYCKVSIWDADKRCWCSKEDVGVESNTENVKGESSDSFKRACVCWGIGRELYTAPKNMWVALRDNEQPNYFRLYCSEIGYDDAGNINKCVLVDGNGEVRYSFGAKAKVASKPQTVPTAPTNKEAEVKRKCGLVIDFLNSNQQAFDWAMHATQNAFGSAEDMDANTLISLYVSMENNPTFINFVKNAA